MIERQAIVLLAVKGAYTSKPRPWVVIQSDDFASTDSVLLCAFTHRTVEGAGRLRIDVAPSAANGLRVRCQLQAEKVVTVRRSDLGRRIGRLEDETMHRLEAALRDVIGL
ncbi:putative endoribonuclease MazF [Beijerinckiaceae bacterium RH AL1]|nr:type II toxin-antitoxin system PemK/MazF family toxin [Beijerinckiaceae bacterium]VVB48347.1 putative endoribonuclease MazF [Beijerinckiaceae bacterium RH CH11]VVB48429.1 putative endoribonuclease MazF [Beijerinckiaceae bacterium RH AL8]VVC56348.1 putative endoribonuclease MazF [Beijerinckiaceae bacterium RH AL1]